MMQKTLGGDRLGSGKRMKVDLHGYERSTHNLGYLWRSTMSAGTLVPFMKKLVLPGDTFDIDLECDIKTHPTIGPLFGSYKVQLDIFEAPIRLYQGQLHNNKLGIGMRMQDIKLPTLTLTATKITSSIQNDLDNSQINPSALLSYLGIRGVGRVQAPLDVVRERDFNAVPLLAYWDIYKNYYANKQEEIGMVVHTPMPAVPNEEVVSIEMNTEPIPEAPTLGAVTFTIGSQVDLTNSGTEQDTRSIIVTTSTGVQYILDDLFYTYGGGVPVQTYVDYKWAQFGDLIIVNWRYISAGDQPLQEPNIEAFDLNNIDDMREAILAAATIGAVPFNINTDAPIIPYITAILPPDPLTGVAPMIHTQEGLGIKTYQSDLFNNWLSTEWIDGVGGINDITAVSTVGDEFKIDALLLARKVYDMLNRIAVSGGTYDDWLDAVYTEERTQRAETPIYHGGLIRELVFQEVVSNSEAESEQGTQPLGTLAGKGIMAGKKKGGRVTVKVQEPGYIIGIISLTPRIDYSQGNDWDIHLETMDDLHKPALDEIGFQELITERMAWWSTTVEADAGPWITRSAGKQPAWIEYMTSVNKTYGNFAVASNEMFMTLNRRYESDGFNILDLTTYIDPVKFNHIFAQTSIDAQNYWAQVSVDITARRKMSAKIMPNL